MKKIIIFSSVILLFLLASCIQKQTPKPTTTNQPPIIKPIQGDFDCQQMHDEIENDLTNANYCQTDTDCEPITLSSVYVVFGCYHYVNKEIDKEQIYNKMDKYIAKCSRIIDKCATAPEAKCDLGKCVEKTQVQPKIIDIIELSSNSQKYLNQTVQIEGRLQDNKVCTKMKCSDTDPCCNQCTVKIKYGGEAITAEGNNCVFESPVNSQNQLRIFKAIGIWNGSALKVEQGWYYYWLGPKEESSNQTTCGNIENMVFCQDQSCFPRPDGSSPCADPGVKGTCYQKCNSDSDCPVSQSCATIECISGDAISYQKVCK